MVHAGHQVMHTYLVHQGMHPNDAHHVVINSGSGIADWFKKNKKTILDTIKRVGSVALPYVKKAIKSTAGEYIDDPMARDAFNYALNTGSKRLTKYLKPKQLTQKDYAKKLLKENNILMKGVSPYFKKYLLKYRREKIGEGVINTMLLKVLEQGEQEENVIEDIETRGLEGLGSARDARIQRSIGRFGRSLFDLFR